MAAKIFKIRDFLENGTFLKDFSTENISCFLKENSNESFGKDIVMYYFYFKGYNISFIYDESKGILKGEQIEIRIQDTGEGIDPEELKVVDHVLSVISHNLKET